MARLLHIKTLPDEQKSSWIDRDALLLHAAFQILVDFVEEEKPYEIGLFASCAWHNSPIPNEEKQHMSEEVLEKQLSEWKRLFALYHWWKNVRKDIEIDPMNEDAYDKDTEKLCELMQLREHLWT